LREEHGLRVFENRVLRRIFGPKREEVMGQWRKLHSGELHNLYSSPDIIRQIKPRRMRWAGHVPGMGRGETCTGFWWESPKEKDHLKDQVVDGRMGSEWLLGGCLGCVKWIILGQDRDCWRAVMNAVTKISFLAPRY
jgi:hypothetical protein